MRVDWMPCGACTHGSTARPGGATRATAASGGAATTSTARPESGRGLSLGDRAQHVFGTSFPASLARRLRAAVCRQRGADDRLVPVHVVDGSDADARRLDDVDGMDADARTELARRCRVLPRHV